MQRHGCISGFGIAVVVVLLALLGVITILQGGPLLASPGPLSAVAPRATPLGGYASHAEFDAECGLCHAPFWSGERMADRCMACHTTVQEEIASASGLHGRLRDPLRCKECHPEHQGRNAPLTRTDIDTFPHEVDLVGFTLKEHRKNFDGSLMDCATCHTVAYGQFDQMVCVDCHRQGQPDFTDQHIAEVGEDCLLCHDGSGEAARFDHDQMTNFPLEGEHREVKCSKCHQEGTYKGLDTACYSCHREDDEHDGQYGTTCESCHTAESWEKTTFSHERTPFIFSGQPLDIRTNCYTCHKRDDEHKGKYGTSCESCHTTDRWEPSTFSHDLTTFVFEGQTLDIRTACYTCHQADDEHNGQYGTQCYTCHTTRSWEEVTFDHNETRLPLVGGHANLECQACHTPDTFTGLDPACVSCHAEDDVHDGQFGTACERCHVADAWDKVTFDHDETAFPLDGAHVNVPCEQCHVNNQYVGTPTECVACHEQPVSHVGVFGTDCATCHLTSAWTPAYLPEHTFPLDHGSTEPLACDVCHDQGTYTTYTCYNCHEHTPENIRAEHLEEGITDYQDCVRCHPTGREEEGEFEFEDDD